LISDEEEGKGLERSRQLREEKTKEQISTAIPNAKKVKKPPAPKSHKMLKEWGQGKNQAMVRSSRKP